MYIFWILFIPFFYFDVLTVIIHVSFSTRVPIRLFKIIISIFLFKDNRYNIKYYFTTRSLLISASLLITLALMVENATLPDNELASYLLIGVCVVGPHGGIAAQLLSGIIIPWLDTYSFVGESGTSL